MDVVNSKVELEGGEDVTGVDGHLVLSSDQAVVQVAQLLVQLGLEEVEVVGRSVHVGDGGAQELVGVVFRKTFSEPPASRKKAFSPATRPPRMERDGHFEGLKQSPMDSAFC